jgi:hypothetical protein
MVVASAASSVLIPHFAFAAFLEVPDTANGSPFQYELGRLARQHYVDADLPVR